MEQAATARKVRIIPASQRTASVERKARNGVKRVAAYCRVSTDSEEQLNSYTAQKTYYTQLISENPEWEMAGIFAEGMPMTDTCRELVDAANRNGGGDNITAVIISQN